MSISVGCHGTLSLTPLDADKSMKSFQIGLDIRKAMRWVVVWAQIHTEPYTTVVCVYAVRREILAGLIENNRIQCRSVIFRCACTFWPENNRRDARKVNTIKKLHTIHSAFSRFAFNCANFNGTNNGARSFYITFTASSTEHEYIVDLHFTSRRGWWFIHSLNEYRFKIFLILFFSIVLQFGF